MRHALNDAVDPAAHGSCKMEDHETRRKIIA